MNKRNVSPLAAESRDLMIQLTNGADPAQAEAGRRAPLMRRNSLRTEGLVAIGHKTTRMSPRRVSTRAAPQRIVVNGEALSLTLETGLARVENAVSRINP